jgi:uncharacterized protein (AIM24 family)
MAQFELLSREGVNWVEIILNNEMVRTESGAMRYIRGNIQMESKAPGVGGFLKSMVTQESAFKPTYTGNGKLVLEPTIYSFFELNLNGETMVLDRGAYWASESTIEVSAQANKAATSLLGGEGWFQTTVKGVGKVIICIPGPVETLQLNNERLVVDGSFAVARSASLNYKVERSTRSMFGAMTSGEGIVNVFEGSGVVHLCPVPNVHVMLAGMIASHGAAAGGTQQASGPGGLLGKIANQL